MWIHFQTSRGGRLELPLNRTRGRLSPLGEGPDESVGPSGSPGAGAGAIGAAGQSAMTAGIADLGVPEIGAVGLILIGLASLAVTILRRQRMRRRLAARIDDRLAAIVGSSSTPARTAIAMALPGGSASPVEPRSGGPALTLTGLPSTATVDRSAAHAAADRR